MKLGLVGLFVVGAVCLTFAACGGKKGESECKKAATRARACIAEVCKDPKLDHYDKKKWCGAKTPLDNPVVAECPAKCGKAFKKGAEYIKPGASCKRTLNGFSNAMSTSMCSGKK